MNKILILLFFNLIFFIQDGIACQCGGYKPFQEEYANAKTILLGKVISKRIKAFKIKTDEAGIIKIKYYTFKIRVKETFKGEKVKIIEVVGNPINAAACGMRFKR